MYKTSIPNEILVKLAYGNARLKAYSLFSSTT